MVTGAGRGIGLALVKTLLEQGKAVIAHHRGAPSSSLQELLDRYPDSLEHVAFDLRKPVGDDVLSALKPGPIDVLVNNAGVFGPRKRRIAPQDHAQSIEAFEVNVIGTVAVTELVLPRLKQSPNPRLAFITSLAGTAAKAAGAPMIYGASKASLNWLIQMFGFELSGDGVAVAGLRPGSVPTDMNPHGRDDPQVCARGIIEVIDRMAPELPTPFWDFTGERLDW